ncbi:MAG TPA: type I 3-dehydroquinate dehydratase [Vicinamibacterales bacterium]|nr:type I 3-dehydroquinate dehydratase [Vicinamibacterales bacterium]
MKSLLCETVTGRSMAELLTARDRATTSDLVELRLDGIVDLDVAAALHGRSRPAVVTCRPTWEGGSFAGSEEERRGILSRALALGAEFVDIEWRAGFDDVIAQDRTRIVLSSHDFDGIPSDLDERARRMRAVGTGMIKIAMTTGRLTDTLRLRRIAEGGRAVVIGMGEAGVPSRLLASRYGSAWTYAGHGVAPGQLPASRMIEDFRFRQVSSSTRLFGVVSTNALHSFSPVMHNAALCAAGIDAVYVPLRAADFDDFTAFAEAMDIEGASVTIPYKIEALRVATRADELTRAVGAANTIRRRGGEWEATNTDVNGFLEPLESAFGPPFAGARASVLGAGGAARAVVVALSSNGVSVCVHARKPEQAQSLARDLGVGAGDWPPAPGSWDLLVNCTPLGGAGSRDSSPLPRDLITGRFVYDLTYGAGDSALLRDARAAGCQTLDGLPMLVAQAERQFEWWTGQRPVPGVMAEAVRRRTMNVARTR